MHKSYLTLLFFLVLEAQAETRYMAAPSHAGTSKGVGNSNTRRGEIRGRYVSDPMAVNPDPALFIRHWFPNVIQNLDQAKTRVRNEVNLIAAVQEDYRGEPMDNLVNIIGDRFERRFRQNPEQVRSFMIAVSLSSREFERREAPAPDYIPGDRPGGRASRTLSYFELLRAASEAFLRAGGLGVPYADTNYSTQPEGSQETEFKQRLFARFVRTTFESRRTATNPFDPRSRRLDLELLFRGGGRNMLRYDDEFPGSIK